MTTERSLVSVIDDDESVCLAIKRLLGSIGLNAATFTDGQDFLALIEAEASFRPACVILDAQMPGLSGLEIQQRLGTAFPIIFITAHDALAVREQAMAAGAAALLRKPFNDELFIETLGSVIGDHLVVGR